MPTIYGGFQAGMGFFQGRDLNNNKDHTQVSKLDDLTWDSRNRDLVLSGGVDTGKMPYTRSYLVIGNTIDQRETKVLQDYFSFSPDSFVKISYMYAIKGMDGRPGNFLSYVVYMPKDSISKFLDLLEPTADALHLFFKELIPGVLEDGSGIKIFKTNSVKVVNKLRKTEEQIKSYEFANSIGTLSYGPKTFVVPIHAGGNTDV